MRTQKQLDRVLAEIDQAPGIVLYTLLEESFALPEIAKKIPAR